jgi:hypothetical protein
MVIFLNCIFQMRYYVTVNNSNRDKVVKYNLDPRRCGMGLSTLSFNKKLVYCEPGRSVVAVKVLTTEPDKETICPKTSCDYFIENILMKDENFWNSSP